MQDKLVCVEDAQLQVSVWGRGEPVVFVQTALTADELLPIAAAPVMDAYRKASITGVDTGAAARSRGHVPSGGMLGNV